MGRFRRRLSGLYFGWRIVRVLCHTQSTVEGNIHVDVRLVNEEVVSEMQSYSVKRLEGIEELEDGVRSG